jgi:glycosyltransferase involved in cell wall biosynthesis
MQVVMVGDSLKKQGGIVTVEKMMLACAPPGIHIHHIGTAVDGSGIGKMFGFIRGLVQLVSWLMTHPVDLVHIHVADNGSAYRKAIVTLIARLFRKPVVLHAHAPEFHLFYPAQPRIMRQWLRYSFQQCDRFIAVSESWKSYYMETLGLVAQQAIAITNPIQVPAHVPTRDHPTDIKIVFLGRIGQRKGAFDLISAFALLSPQNRKNATLILAGDGEIDQARDLIQKLNLQDSITLLNWLTPTDRDQLMASANIFVLPSYNEGLPLSLLEAMGWSLPVLTTPVGGIPNLITHHTNGLLCPPGDIRQIAKELETLIQDEALRTQLGEQARQDVLPFDVKNYFLQLTDIYHAIGKVDRT